MSNASATTINLLHSDGTVKRNVFVHPSQPFACIQCLTEDGKLHAAKAGDIDTTPYRFTLADGIYTHRRCGRTMRVLDDAGTFHHVTRAELHITDDLRLSHRIPAEMWATVSTFFAYHKFADLAEFEEDMDNFSLADSFRSMGSGGDWFISDPATVEELEFKLDILPQNTTAARSAQKVKAASERRAAQAAAAESAKQKETLFNSRDGEYIPRSDRFDGNLTGLTINWRDGHDVYGGGTEFVLTTDGFIWLVINNGRDGDDWSSNNIHTGGAGAIGYRFLITPERIAFLRTLPGGDKIAVPEEQLKAEALALVHNHAVAQGDPIINHLFAPLEPRVPSTALHIYSKLGGMLVSLAPNESEATLTAPGPAHKLSSQAGFRDWHDVTIAYTPTPELATAIKSTWPGWVHTAQPGRYIIRGGGSVNVWDNAADALRCACWGCRPVDKIEVTPDVEVTSLNKTVVMWSDGLVIDRKNFGARFFRGHDEEADELTEAGFPPVPPAVEYPSILTPAASELLLIARRDPHWTQDQKLLKFTLIASFTAENLAKNGGSNHAYELDRLNLTIVTGELSTLYRLQEEHWSMGEDGDYDKRFSLYESETEAQAEANEFHRDMNN